MSKKVMGVGSMWMGKKGKSLREGRKGRLVKGRKVSLKKAENGTNRR